MSTVKKQKNPWSKLQQENIGIILSVSSESGIKNEMAQAAILAIVSKESSLKPQSEASYRNTSAERIKKIFRAARGYSDADVDRIKKDDEKFWEMVYGHQTEKGRELGNTKPGDGAKYRGRGFNQITGRFLYERYGKLTKTPLIDLPEILNSDLEVAAKVLVAFLGNGISALIKNGRLRKDYGASNANDFRTLESAIYAYYNCNAGIGKSFSQIKQDPTGGLKKALENGPALLDYIRQLKDGTQ